MMLLEKAETKKKLDCWEYYKKQKIGETHSLTNGELAFLAIRHKAFLRLIRPEIPKQRRTFEAIWDVYFKEKEREKFPGELELKSFSVVTVF